jgi:lipoyl-dependent peroxiredoxin
MPNTAKAEWEGGIQNGRGHFSAGESVGGEYSFDSRFADGEGVNPEQLLAAAHAACFSMALSLVLSEAGTSPDSIETDARVDLRRVEGIPTITSISLSTIGRVPGVDEEVFRSAAEDAKEGCILSRALGGVGEITVEARLAEGGAEQSRPHQSLGAGQAAGAAR